MKRRGRGVGWLVVTLMIVTGPALSGQVQVRNTQGHLLRDAASRESRGDLDGAEEVLRRLLESDPGSSGGLFALERVLGSKNAIVTILPAVDAYLEEDPGSSGVRALKLRVLADADSFDAVRQEAETWMGSEFESELPYREISRVYGKAFGRSAALAVLLDGRVNIGDPGALALEIGDLLAARGDIDRAVEEWVVAVGDNASHAATITRRVQGLTTGVIRAGTLIVERLRDSDEIPRRRAAARMALDLGLVEMAMPTVLVVASDLEGRSRTKFLTEVARRARDNDLVEVASWAYTELGEGAATLAERRQFDQRIVDVSLASGDTVSALEAQRRVALSYAPRSADRRRATAQVICLEGVGAGVDRLHGLLSGFRDEFPDAPEIDALAATVALALHEREDSEGAAAVIDGLDGPKSSLERGYLLLAAGDLEEGHSVLLRALTGLPPTEATGVIQLLGLFSRVSETSAEALAVTAVEAHKGHAIEAATMLVDAVPGLKEGERAPLLAQAARIAALGGGSELAARIRVQMVSDYPDAPEVGEASLALARFYVGRSNLAEAIRLLENVITLRPNASVAPDARVELERLMSGGSRR